MRPLPLGHRLGELQLDEVLGIGGFGIVYRAFDRTLRRAVAIKEYMPSMLATRGGDYTVSLRSERFAQAFDAGRGAFSTKRVLAQFDHPAVKVLHFWESHGTAYMVMPFYEGRTLQLLDGGMRISETQLRNIVGALLGALDTLHRAQCFHRDVALDNVLIRPNGSAILLDFGAAANGSAPGRRWRDDDQARLCADRAVHRRSRVQPGAVDRPLCARRGDAMITGELPPAAVVRSIRTRTGRSRRANCRPAEVYSPAFSRGRSCAAVADPGSAGIGRGVRGGAGRRDRWRIWRGGRAAVGDAQERGRGRLLLRPLRRLLARLRSARAGPLRATLRRMGER